MGYDFIQMIVVAGLGILYPVGLVLEHIFDSSYAYSIQAMHAAIIVKRNTCRSRYSTKMFKGFKLQLLDCALFHIVFLFRPVLVGEINFQHFPFTLLYSNSCHHYEHITAKYSVFQIQLLRLTNVNFYNGTKRGWTK